MSLNPGQLLGRTLPVFLLAALLSACGFSLRSNEVISSKFASLTLNLQQPNGEIARQLRRALMNSNVEINDSNVQPGVSIPVLSVSAEQLFIQPVTVNPRARAAQYDIRLSITVSLLLGEENLVGPEDLSVQRVHFEDTANIAGNLDEIELIQSEMRRELVNQLLRRLEAVEPTTLANQAT